MASFSLSQICFLIFAAVRCNAAAAHTPSMMHQYSPEWKQHVLQHCRVGERGSGFRALAHRFAVESTVRSWHKQ